MRIVTKRLSRLDHLWLDVLLTFIALSFSFTWAQDRCGTVGDSDENEAAIVTDTMFYLNTANPAPCAGNITSWRVCYYGPESVEFSRYGATYALYRRADSGRRYEQVSGIYSAVRSHRNFAGGNGVDGEIEEGGFNCYDDPVDLPVTVQAGDLVGACVFTSSAITRQLNIVSDVMNNEESLQGMEANGCTVNNIPSSITANQLKRRKSRRLHLYANIKVPTMTEAIISTTAVTGSTDAGLNTEPPTQKPQTTTSSQGSTRSGSSPGTIIGVMVAILLTLILGVAIGLVVLYLLRHRQAGGRYSTRKGEKVSGLDNMVYGNGCRNPTILEDSLYEVPVNAMQHAEKNEQEFVGLTYADPHPYEYATLGPNEEMVTSSEHYYSPLDEVTISYAKLLEKNKQEDIYGDVNEFQEPASEENELYAQLKECGIRNILSSFVQIEGHLGSGQFGSVEQGLWKNGANSVSVALKLLKEGATQIDKTKFLQEAAIMAQFRHPNVVTLYGVVSKTEPLMLVVELIEKGDLRNYLHTLRPDPGELPTADLPTLLLSFCKQVALGMQYLSAKGFVHRDLAARNILVSNDNVCKVADFGMSRDLADENYYVSQGGKIPLKWTAPEAIHYKKYSTASDVWSYGCLLYEIWSLGYKPFEGIMNAKVLELVDSGKRLSPPPSCPRLIYELMIKCWNPVASQRPSFREILLSLLGTPEIVLAIPQEDLETHLLAGMLGSPLEAGENMYCDLQNRYVGTNCDDYQEVD